MLLSSRLNFTMKKTLNNQTFSYHFKCSLALNVNNKTFGKDKTEFLIYSKKLCQYQICRFHVTDSDMKRILVHKLII